MVIRKLEDEYKKITNVESKALGKAKGEIGRYVEELTKAAAAASKEPTSQEASAGSNGSAAVHGGKV